ncbi:hypothetical protein MMC08_000469 [Hypocenomyce scalaris]|nr:hypothetical protein [Hypocenomyce scalaris]
MTVSPTTTVVATITNTATITDSYTVTMTVSPTTTDVATITNTATVIDTIIAPLTVPLTKTITVAPAFRKRDNADLRGSKVTIAPRQMTQVPSSIPSYASACSGSVRYSSACSCIGVTKSTTTAPTPSTTVTVTATAVQTVLTTKTSSATQTLDVTATSLITAVQTVLATQTISATQTLDVTATSLDSIIVATQTVVGCGPTPTFILQAIGGGVDNGMYAQIASSNDGLNDEDIVFVSSASAATAFNIDAAGHLNYDGYYANIEAGVQHFLFYFNTPADISAYGYVYATCSLDVSNMLKCVDQTSTMFQISPLVENSGDGGAGVVIGAYIEQGNTPVSFQATCV